jgi:hypothetical protein
MRLITVLLIIAASIPTGWQAKQIANYHTYFRCERYASFRWFVDYSVDSGDKENPQWTCDQRIAAGLAKEY